MLQHEEENDNPQEELVSLGPPIVSASKDGIKDETIPSEVPDNDNMEIEDESIGSLPTKIAESLDIPEYDDGKHLLYPNVMASFLFKTTDRLIDDIVCDLTIKNPDPNDHTTILNLPPLQYSKLRHSTHPLTFGSSVNQVSLETKFEYESVTCPKYNKCQVLLGVLFDPNKNNISDTNDIIQMPIYQVKVTVKTRAQLELYKKHAGISQYFKINNLHPFDQRDLLTFDPTDPNLVDYAIYVSADTNRLILIEIFNPEFDSNEELESFSEQHIKKRYLSACEKYEELDAEHIPTQLDCINTMLKLFRGPLTRKHDDDPVKVIPSDNVALNSHMNPEWLVEKYGFSLNSKEESDAEQPNYVPPDLTHAIEDRKVRKQKESYIKKCLHLIFLAKTLIAFMDTQTKQELNNNSKSYRILNGYSIQTSTKPLFQLLGETRSNFALTSEQVSPLDTNYHFINLSSSYYYTDRDIILNYETSIQVDKANIGIYFDALSFIANRKGSYQLLGYCGKQNIVGHEALNNALRVFKINPDQVNVDTALDEKLILSLYQQEQLLQSDSNYLSDLKNAFRILAKYKSSDFLQFYISHEPYRLLSQAYSELEINESVDDDIVQTAFTIKINDSPGLQLECTRALYTIALHKRSMTLFNFLLDQCPLFLKYYDPNKFTYREALSMIQVNENANDELILKIFQQKWEHESLLAADQLLNLKAALSKICMETNSKLIANFIETGLIDPNCLPPENWPTGLNNIGNTCYLNSLLQYYFAIAPVREYICQYRNTFKDFEDIENNSILIRRIGGRQVSATEVERSIQFTYQLRDLFQKMIYSNNRCVTPSQELAYLAFAPSNVEVEFETSSTKAVENNANTIDEDFNAEHVEESEMDIDDLKDEIKETDDEFKKTDDNIVRIPIEEESEDVDDENNMEIDTPPLPAGCDEKRKIEDEEDTKSDTDNNFATSTKVAKISVDQLENTLEIGRQQDVTECIGNVLYQLESASKPLSLDESQEQDDLIKQLFYGKTKQDIIPVNDTDDVRVKYERFLSLMVTISDHPKNIYDALDAYFMDEYLKLEEYGDVRRTLSITEFPTILQVQIQRVYYDRERFMPFKSIEPLPFSQTIYMDRYADTENAELMKKKKGTAEMKQKLKELQARQKELLSRNEAGLSRKDSYMETVKFLKSDVLSNCDIELPESDVSPPDLIHGLEECVNDNNNELSKLYHDITQLQNKIDHQFDEFQDMAYSLFAVFIHRGEASYGHYWTYIKDFQNEGIWRKYNDETVSEIHEDEVFNFVEGNTATPYFLVLVKKDHEIDIEPLKRIIEAETLD